MDKKWDGRVALVTGGAAGIGRATALAFARNGANIVIADLNAADAGDTIHLLDEHGVDAMFVQCDVSKDDDVKHLMSEIMKRFGRLDFAFNNAGIEGEMGSLHSASEDNWFKTIDVNLHGVWRCMREEIPVMLETGSGAIVNCASIAGLRGFAGLAAYVASKHGVVGLSKAAALEYASQGLRINAVCPGVIHTSMIDRVTGGDSAIEKQYISMEPIGRMGDPDEVAAAVIWLCAAEASFVTGIALPVDGGFCAK